MCNNSASKYLGRKNNHNKRTNKKPTLLTTDQTPTHSSTQKNMCTHSNSHSSSSLQWQHRRRIEPRFQIQRFHTTSQFLHNTLRFLVHSRLQYDNLSPIRGSSWTQTRHWLVLDQPKSELLRSRRRNVNHGAGGPTSNDDDNDDDNGTMAGAVAMIIGTSIGSGMLALPQRTSPAGLLPTSISMITCWCFLVLEALLLVEVNVNLRKRKKKTRDANSPKQRNELEVISIRTMAKETLGEWGGALATLAYIFLGYTSMVAYCSKSGEILLSLAYLPPSSSGCFFTLLVTSLIVVGGTQITDHVNQWLTTFMIGLLLAIEAVALAFGGWAEPVSNGDWGEVPPAIPAMIFALVYHDIIPVICAYFKGDVKRIRTSVILGSLIPLVALLVWEAIALGLSSSPLPHQNIDPIEFLMRVRWSGMPFMVGAFSLLAVGTSMIGTLLGFSEFFKEQLNNIISSGLHSALLPKTVGVGSWWGRNRISCAAMVLAVGPSLFLSTKFPDAFSAATDVAGGYCMTVLFGVLPPAMAWAMDDKKDEVTDRIQLSKLRPAALVGVGVFASGVVVEQIMQDFPVLNALHIN